MKGVSQVLQFPVIVKLSRPPIFELQPLQELDFLVGGIAAERSILEELFKAWFYVEGPVWFPFDELKSFQVRKSQPAI